MDDLEDIEQLVLERREPELRKLIERLRAEIKQRQQLLREAEQLLFRTTNEIKLLERIDVPTTQTAPALRPTTEPAKKPDYALEKKREERSPLEEELRHVEMRPKSLSEIYTQLKQEAKNAYEARPYERNDKLYELMTELDEKKRAIEEGTYKPDEKAKHLLSAAEELVQSMYKGTAREQYK